MAEASVPLAKSPPLPPGWVHAQNRESPQDLLEASTAEAGGHSTMSLSYLTFLPLAGSGKIARCLLGFPNQPPNQAVDQ